VAPGRHEQREDAVMLYAFLQRYFIKSVAAFGLKE
jgi:hypothetical protein